jgi:hypothetical protein
MKLSGCAHIERGNSLNEQSLQAANAFLKVAAASSQPGEFLAQPPADIGREAGLANPLAVARAVRALAARRRLEVEDGRYRLLDTRPLEPGEPESVPRAPRRRKAKRKGGGTRTEAAGAERRPSYSDLGRAVIERVIELGREAGEAVAGAEHLRREAKENKAARIEAEQRASRLFERVKELEAKLDMAEANLRTVLAAARGRGATAGPTDNEMEALLRILKAPAGTQPDGAPVPEAAEPAEPEEAEPAEEAAAE